MENGNYYDILGVSVNASLPEIAAAKIELAKRYHPDANIKDGLDTTSLMQEILKAYEVLSDPQTRAAYDREITGKTAKMRTFDLKRDDLDAVEDTFVTYWKAAGSLYELTIESRDLFHQKDTTSRLTQLSLQAIHHIIVLREGEIPEKYWHPDIMNWLLFTWYQNRNITVSYLLTLYDDYLKKRVTPVEKLRMQSKIYKFRHSVKKLVKN